MPKCTELSLARIAGQKNQSAQGMRLIPKCTELSLAIIAGIPTTRTSSPRAKAHTGDPRAEAPAYYGDAVELFSNEDGPCLW